MEALKIALFKNPLGIYIALAIVGVLGLVSYQNWRTFKSAWPTAVALIVGAAVFTVSTLVVTDREQIGAACEKIANAISNRNTVVVEFLLDEEFTGLSETQTRKKAIRRLDSDLKAYGVTGVKFKILDLNVRDSLANMLVRSDITSETIPAMRLNWRVIWIKRPTGWLVYRVSGPAPEPSATVKEEE